MVAAAAAAVAAPRSPHASLSSKDSTNNTSTAELFSRTIMSNTMVASYLQRPIYLLAARDHDYRLDSPMAMRVEAATLSPGPLSRYVLGAYAAVGMLSTRRDLVNNLFLDPRLAQAKFCAYDNEDDALDPTMSTFSFPYSCSGANVVRVFTPSGGARLLSVDDCVPYCPGSEDMDERGGPQWGLRAEHAFGEERSATEAWVPLAFKALLRLCALGKVVELDQKTHGMQEEEVEEQTEQTEKKELDGNHAGRSSPAAPYCIEAQTRVLSTLSVDDAFAALTGCRLTRLQVRSELIRRRQQRLARDRRDSMKIGTGSPSPEASEEVISQRGLMRRTWKRMLHAVADGDLVGVSVLKEKAPADVTSNDADTDADADGAAMQGLVPGFTYTILDAREIACFPAAISPKSRGAGGGGWKHKSTRRMVLLHNPWRPKNAKDLPMSERAAATAARSKNKSKKSKRKKNRHVSKSRFWPLWRGKWSLTDPAAALETWERYPEAQSSLLHVSRPCRRDSFWVEWGHFAPRFVDSVLISHCVAAKGIFQNARRARNIRENNRRQHDGGFGEFGEFGDSGEAKTDRVATRSRSGLKRVISHRRVHSAKVPARPSVADLRSLQHAHSIKREQTLLAADRSQAGWQRRSVCGRWVRCGTAGGSCDFATWRNNPQFEVDAPKRASHALVTLRLLPPTSIVGIDTEVQEKEGQGMSPASPYGVALYVFPARPDGLPIVSPDVAVLEESSVSRGASPRASPRSGSAAAARYGFTRVVASTEITVELELGPATGPLVVVPTTQLPGTAGRFEIEVLFDSAGMDPDQVVIRELNDLDVSSMSAVCATEAKTLDDDETAGSAHESKQRRWFHYERQGSWYPGRSAGGCRISSKFGENTAFLAVPEEKSVGVASEQVEMYAVVSFHRGSGGGSGGGDSSPEEVIWPLVAGCHCFATPTEEGGGGRRGEGQEDPLLPREHLAGQSSLVDPAEAARSTPGAFEVFKMFGEKRMRLSTPFLYPELGGRRAMAAHLPRKVKEARGKDGKRKKRRTSIIEAAEVGAVVVMLLVFGC